MERTSEVLGSNKRICIVLQRFWKSAIAVLGFLTITSMTCCKSGSLPLKVEESVPSEEELLKQQRSLEKKRAQILFKLPEDKLWLLFLIEEQADKYEIPTDIAYALVAAESNYELYAVNKNSDNTVDEGLLQLNSSNREFFTKQFWKETYEYNPFNPQHATDIGFAYLKDLYNYFKSWEKALAAYNCGSSRVSKNTIPISTKQHVKKILTYAALIRDGLTLDNN